ncbi:MAG TPA: inorganic phosphate transporter [Thermoplasmata archaeon]|nr:inorganic phosphate transporter [Thermoplasmata archaeon]
MVEFWMIVLFVVIIALFFDYVNGFHDAANSISTIVATRVLTPVKAVLLASTFNFIGIVFLPTVAATVGKGIIKLPTGLDPTVAVVIILAALVGAIFWDLFTWWFGIPSSSSHALVGGLLGAGLVGLGVSGLVSPRPGDVILLLAWACVGAVVGIVVWSIAVVRVGGQVTGGTVVLGGLFGAVFAIVIVTFLPKAFPHPYLPTIKDLLATVTFIAVSPLIGMAVSFLLSVGVMRLVRRSKMHPNRANPIFRRLQIFSSAFYSFNHGINDAQKTMGVITLLLVSGGLLAKFEVPLWVALSAHAAIALGTFTGGWRIVKTMATRITSLKAHQGFAAETGGGGVLTLMALGGIPVSTTHAIAGSIMGVGAVQGLSAVRWGVSRRLIFAWIITIPASALVAAISFFALRPVFGI